MQQRTLEYQNRDMMPRLLMRQLLFLWQICKGFDLLLGVLQTALINAIADARLTEG
jgi:hypothetical protein